MDILILSLIIVIGWSAWIVFRHSLHHRKVNLRSKRPDRPSEKRVGGTVTPTKPVNMPEPHSRPLTSEDELKAFKDGQPIWIRYEDQSGKITERVIEIYRPGDSEMLFTWCRRKQAPRAFLRRNIRNWRLLPERFNFDPIVAQYWDEETIRGRTEKNPWRRWLRRQPKEIADRYE